MDANILLLADFANIDPLGKLNIIGAFATIFSETFPATHPQMHIVVRLTAGLGEFEQLRILKIILWDQDGKIVWNTPEIKFKITAPPTGKLGQHNAIIGLQGMIFQRPGTYAFNVYVDQDLKGSIPVELVLLERPLKDASNSDA